MIDDFVPCKEDGTVAFAKSTDTDDIWPCLVEKAFAKVHGNYDNIIAGFTLEAFGILTGAPTTMLLHKKNPDIMDQIEEAAYRQYMITSVSIPLPKAEKKDFKSEFGLISSHAYTVLRVCEI